MKICMCGTTGDAVTTTCDHCNQPLCRKCSVIITPNRVNGDIEIKHIQCMPKKFQTKYYEVKNNE